MIICMWRGEGEKNHHSFRESWEFHDDDERLFITSSKRYTGLYCNDLNYKNLFTIIWDNFRKHRWWKGREKKMFAEKLSMMHLSLFCFLLLRLCVYASQRYWQWRSLILIFIIAFFFWLKYSMTPTNSSPDFVKNFCFSCMHGKWLRYHRAYTDENFIL